MRTGMFNTHTRRQRSLSVCVCVCFLFQQKEEVDLTSLVFVVSGVRSSRWSVKGLSQCLWSAGSDVT